MYLIIHIIITLLMIYFINNHLLKRNKQTQKNEQIALNSEISLRKNEKIQYKYLVSLYSFERTITKVEQQSNKISTIISLKILSNLASFTKSYRKTSFFHSLEKLDEGFLIITNIRYIFKGRKYSETYTKLTTINIEKNNKQIIIYPKKGKNRILKLK